MNTNYRPVKGEKQTGRNISEFVIDLDESIIPKLKDQRQRPISTLYDKNANLVATLKKRIIRRIMTKIKLSSQKFMTQRKIY